MGETIITNWGKIWLIALAIFYGTSYVSGRDSFQIGPCIWVNNLPCPDDKIAYYLYTSTSLYEKQRINLTDYEGDLSEFGFNKNFPTKIIIHGYNSDDEHGDLVHIKDEYMAYGDYNVFMPDWSPYCLAPCYPFAVQNTKHAGKCLATLVSRLQEIGASEFHVIGFSLGAHVAGRMSGFLKPYKLPRISGLDPAMPLFVTSNKDRKLDPSDAEFVDIVHTNALVQGKVELCGHVDFYMNGGFVQPGCSQDSNPLSCNHHRAPKYFGESIRTDVGFWGWKCANFLHYILGLCKPENPPALMGAHVNHSTAGMYIVDTASSPPFALGPWTAPDFNAKNFTLHVPSYFRRYMRMFEEEFQALHAILGDNSSSSEDYHQ